MSLGKFPFKSLLLGILSTLTFSLPALADQCAYVSKQQALLAISRLNVGQSAYFFCEPCGDKQPEMVKVSSLGVETVDHQSFWQVKVNGRDIDLAYTFIESGINKQAMNLAGVAGCPAQGVSDVLVLK